MAPKLVLDTNAFRSLSDARLDAIAARGLNVSVSEIAFTETWARSVRDFKVGKPRREARGQFYGRARRLRRYIDDEYPVALIGRPLIERLRQQLVNENPPDGPDRFAPFMRAQWRTVVGIGHTDEEWLAFGEQHGGWLAEAGEETKCGGSGALEHPPTSPTAAASNIFRACTRPKLRDVGDVGLRQRARPLSAS